MHILDKIVADRKKQIEEKGYHSQITIPETREVPITPFIKDHFIITEIKRCSPSKGSIGKIQNPLKQAQIYLSRGSKHISILTEENHFQGSLTDLIEVKKHFPHAAILRKDFLLEPEDIRVSYQAGADALLLIASILTQEKLKQLYDLTIQLGMTPLVELHTHEDVKKAKLIKPILTGINCRDLRHFTTDLLHPLKIQKELTWETSTVFESGIHSQEQAEFAFSSGFNAILTGESVVKTPELIPRFLAATQKHKQLQTQNPEKNFFKQLIARQKGNRALVKICGITGLEDAQFALEQGVDVIGFVMAKSPRKVNADFIESLQQLPILKVAVVVNLHQNKTQQKEILRLLRMGAIDAVQYHGDEPPEFCSQFGVDYYKALAMSEAKELVKRESYYAPRVLLDAFSPDAKGGNGKQINSKILEKVNFPLWLAGGITPDNALDLICQWKPELIDLSSGVELAPGIKDHAKIKALMQIIRSEKP